MSYREIEAAEVPLLHPVSCFSAFWHGRKIGDAVPLRSDIEPTKIPAILPWLMILEVIEIEGVTRFRYRLTGTGCREIFGIDFTGKLLGEALTPEGAEIRRREFLSVIDSRQPIYSWSELPIAERDFMKVYRGAFPVSCDGERVDQIFVIIGMETLELNPVTHAQRPRRQQVRMSAL